MTLQKRISKFLFQDSTGKYVVGQPPNIPIYLIIFSVMARTLIKTGKAHDLAAFVASASIFLWAYLEIVYGESAFRRLLGVVVMISLLLGVVSS